MASSGNQHCANCISTAHFRSLLKNVSKSYKYDQLMQMDPRDVQPHANRALQTNVDTLQYACKYCQFRPTTVQFITLSVYFVAIS